MIYTQIDQKTSINDYIEDIKLQGINVFVSSQKTTWIQSEGISMHRFPLYNFQIPSSLEIDEVLGVKGNYLASYVVKASKDVEPNAVLYICNNKQYNLLDLPSSVQRNIKKAQKDIVIKKVSPCEFLKNGISAFCDTRKRVGLDDGTPEHFYKKFSNIENFKTMSVWGAYIREDLVAYIIVTAVEKWIEINLYSSTQYLSYRPNDYLIYFVLSSYLIQENIEFISFGLSSLQLGNTKEGLHRFKLKMGFKEIPVKRIFVIDKKFKFVKWFFSKKIISLLLILMPQNRRLKKIRGVLELL